MPSQAQIITSPKDDAMNIQKIMLLPIFLFSSLNGYAQEIQVYDMSVNHYKESLNTKDKFEVKLFVPIDVTNFVNINQEKTSFKTIAYLLYSKCCIEACPDSAICKPCRVDSN
ncbi:MAG TPA: hypothetical protein VK982_16200 [Bacteroidales bacterium]|nr:hypothetical protein [Bacteroidales bacterium]